jgi:hypothetical protein
VSSSRPDSQSDARQSAAGVSSESKRAVAEAFVSLARVVSFGGGSGPAEEGGARRGLRHGGGRMRRVEGEKGKERVVGKAVGDERRFWGLFPNREVLV